MTSGGQLLVRVSAVFASDDEQAIHRVRDGLRANLGDGSNARDSTQGQQTRTFPRAPKSHAGYIIVTGRLQPYLWRGINVSGASRRRAPKNLCHNGASRLPDAVSRQDESIDSPVSIPAE